MTTTDLKSEPTSEAELLSGHSVNSAQIGDSVDRATVLVHEAVDTIEHVWVDRETVKRARGVRFAAPVLAVRLPREQARSDATVAGTILGALQSDAWVPETVRATVHCGMVTLQGQVNWSFERDAAVRAIRNLQGVVGVHNLISLDLRVLPAQVKEHVRRALLGGRLADATSIQVEISGSKVTLRGHASNWQSVAAAQGAAWAAPGVTQVIDRVQLLP